MSRTPRTRSRLQRRNERAARQPGAAPRPPRERTPVRTAHGPKRGISGTNIAVFVAVAALIGFLFYAVMQATSEPGPTHADRARMAEMDDDPRIPGVYFPPHPGADGIPGTDDDRRHVAPGVVIPICTEQQLAEGRLSDPSYGPAGVCYHSNPPTSGPHSSQPAQFTNLEHPARKEDVVHSMEHGGVYIWYNTTDQAAIDLIKSVVGEQVDRRRFVGSTIYREMESETIAITSWTRLDKFPVSELTRDRLLRFINENHKRFNPEGF